jgi:hypothetical protein
LIVDALSGQVNLDDEAFRPIADVTSDDFQLLLDLCAKMSSELFPLDF